MTHLRDAFRAALELRATQLLAEAWALTALLLAALGRPLLVMIALTFAVMASLREVAEAIRAQGRASPVASAQSRPRT